MRNIRLEIEYDGTNYHGWQSQRNANTVQNVLSDAVRRLTSEDCKITGAGRTDAGVHAVAQVANFHTNSRIPADKFAYALNSLLPGDITIRGSSEADKDFNARFSATSKRYRYLIVNGAQPSALMRDRAWFVRQPLDFDRMCVSAGYFIGTHDFKAFMSTGSKVKSTVRTVHESRISEICCDCSCSGAICYEIHGSGFLYNMVRIIIGTIVDIGLHRYPPETIPEILASGNRKLAGKTAPPHGLYLAGVSY